jgi:hypothetical protein
MASCSDNESDQKENVVPGSDSDSDHEENAASGSESNVDGDLDSKSQRGPTIKAKAKKKTVVTYNKRGVPTGKAATKLSTFEGLVARSMVNITYDSWLTVDNETKEACWKYVNVSILLFYSNYVLLLVFYSNYVLIHFLRFRHILNFTKTVGSKFSNQSGKSGKTSNIIFIRSTLSH